MGMNVSHVDIFLSGINVLKKGKKISNMTQLSETVGIKKESV